MAARNKPAGIRSLVYGIAKAKVGIESLSVSEQVRGASSSISKDLLTLFSITSALFIYKSY